MIYFRSFFSQLQRLLILNRLKDIKLVVCDVDGVLTDGGLYYDPDGLVSKRFDVHDGIAVRMLQHSGITLAFISGGKSGATVSRAQDLDIKYCYVNVKDKTKILKQLCSDLNILFSETAFIGDDLNDLPVKFIPVFLAVPSDAVKALKTKADWVLSSSGGHGAFRELSDAILASKGKLNNFNRFGMIHSNN